MRPGRGRTVRNDCSIWNVFSHESRNECVERESKFSEHATDHLTSFSSFDCSVLVDHLFTVHFPMFRRHSTIWIRRWTSCDSEFKWLDAVESKRIVQKSNSRKDLSATRDMDNDQTDVVSSFKLVCVQQTMERTKETETRGRRTRPEWTCLLHFLFRCLCCCSSGDWFLI